MRGYENDVEMMPRPTGGRVEHGPHREPFGMSVHRLDVLGPVGLLGLQRAAGNAAIALSVQRCGPGGCGGGDPAGQEDEVQRQAEDVEEESAQTFVQREDEEEEATA